jgi:hypothetical protein
MGKGFCMGLPLISVRHPAPGIDRIDHSLAAGVDVDALDDDLLIFAPVSAQNQPGSCLTANSTGTERAWRATMP